MPTDPHAAILILVMALVTMLLRFLPFFLFSGRKTPAYITYLGQVLPSAIIGMLVVYCLRNTAILSAPFGLPELLAGLAVVLIQIRSNNSLASILGGTILYMVLIQFVF